VSGSGELGERRIECSEHVCVNNLGGISNVTSLDWSSGRKPMSRCASAGPFMSGMTTSVSSRSISDACSSKMLVAAGGVAASSTR
jgi:hypothetical protein